MIRKSFPPTMCRLCGLNKSHGLNVCSTSAKRTGLLFKINKRLSKEIVHITVGDGLPKFVCTDCEIVVNDFANFCKMVHEVQKRLQDEKFSFEEISQKNEGNTDAARPVDGYPAQQRLCEATVTVGPDGKVECKLCQSYLEAVEHTTLHMVSHGIGTVICRCRICGQQGELAQFLKSSCGREDKTSVWCESCRFLLPEKPKTESSVKCKPSDCKQHTCEMCCKVFRSRAHLMRHRIVHSGAKPFLCEVCGTGFSQKSSLKLHVLSHAGLNPHKCDQCGQSFRFKASLRSHVMSLHWPNSVDSGRNQTSYRCDQCDKQFATVYKFRRHYRSHTGERPYECSRCGRLFSQTGNLNLHRKKHEEEDACLPHTEKNHLTHSLIRKSADEQFNTALLPQEQQGPPAGPNQYINQSNNRVLENTHDPKFLVDSILQHPVINPLSTLDPVLLQPSEKEPDHTSQFVSLSTEFGTTSAHMTPPQYLAMATDSNDKGLQQKSSAELFTHFSPEGLLYMDETSNMQDSTSPTQAVTLPTFSSLQSNTSVPISLTH